MNNENYIVINGKKAELTEEQLKALGIEAEPENPFAGEGRLVYTIIEPGGVDKVVNSHSLRENGLAFKDMDFAKQVALHQLLYRLLLKYAYDTNTIDRSEWNGINEHFTIVRNDRSFYGVRVWRMEKMMNAIYFDTEKHAIKAIDDVILPFEKKHPEFVW